MLICLTLTWKILLLFYLIPLVLCGCDEIGVKKIRRLKEVLILLSGYLIVYRKGCFFELTDVSRDDKRTERYDQEVEDVREVDSRVLADERCCSAK